MLLQVLKLPFVVIQQFNVGLHQIMVIVDDVHGDTANVEPKARTKNDVQENERKRKRKLQKDEEFGVTRGLDFKSVGTVINLEVPNSIEGYVHR